MRRCEALPKLLLALSCLVSLLLASGPAAAQDDAGPDEPAAVGEEEAAGDVPPGDPISVGDLVEGLPAGYGERRLAACAESDTPQLNEVCSVGVECDPDVRVGDFIELYNPGATDVDLECFALASQEGGPFVARAVLPPNEVRGFGEADLGFRIRKSQDVVTLYLITSGAEGDVDLVPIEDLRVDAESGLSFRSPDGASWKHLSVEEAERDWPGSFDARNPTPDLQSR